MLVTLDPNRDECFGTGFNKISNPSDINKYATPYQPFLIANIKNEYYPGTSYYYVYYI
jgi:hypothetical protein